MSYKITEFTESITVIGNIKMDKPVTHIRRDGPIDDYDLMDQDWEEFIRRGREAYGIPELNKSA